VQLPMKIEKYPGFDNKNFQVIIPMQVVAGMTVVNFNVFSDEFMRTPDGVFQCICGNFEQP